MVSRTAMARHLLGIGNNLLQLGIGALVEILEFLHNLQVPGMLHGVAPGREILGEFAGALPAPRGRNTRGLQKSYTNLLFCLRLAAPPRGILLPTDTREVPYSDPRKSMRGVRQSRSPVRLWGGRGMPEGKIT